MSIIQGSADIPIENLFVIIVLNLHDLIARFIAPAAAGELDRRFIKFVSSVPVMLHQVLHGPVFAGQSGHGLGPEDHGLGDSHKRAGHDRLPLDGPGFLDGRPVGLEDGFNENRTRIPGREDNHPLRRWPSCLSWGHINRRARKGLKEKFLRNESLARSARRKKLRKIFRNGKI